MRKKYQLFAKGTGLNPYVWLIFCILPFYFIFQSSSQAHIISGVSLILLFFVCYWLTFAFKGWPVYVGMSIQIAICIVMTTMFSYAYFAFFLAFFIGNIQNRAGFITLYTIHLVSTVVTVNIGFATQDKFFISQSPFILINLIGVILLPLNNYNRNKQGELQEQLNDANKRIAELVKLEERQRIARDLHDTLGQKLSVIGLKSDLASKLIYKQPERAHMEIKDVQQTARTALKEVRQIVSQMRGTKMDEELYRVRQMLQAAEIAFHYEGPAELSGTSLLAENVLSMCLKEAVTNIVRHSGASECRVTLEQTATDTTMKVQDNGNGITRRDNYVSGNGLKGMKERLEFVNGSLEIVTATGTLIIATIPHAASQPKLRLTE